MQHLENEKLQRHNIPILATRRPQSQMTTVHPMRRAVRVAKRSLLTAALACTLACSVLAAPPSSPDIDLVRLESSYDSGNQRVRDAALEAHLAQIIKRLSDTSPELAALPVRVRVLRENLPYAFALDSGASYVSTGLIARLANEAQLAAVMAIQLAPGIRHDEQALNRTTNKRILAQAIPNVLLIMVTAALAAPAISKGSETAYQTERLRLQAASDAAAQQWLRQAGYDPRDAPRGMRLLLDDLTREQRFGDADLNRADTLTSRIEALSKGEPASEPSSASSASSVQSAPAPADWFRAAARRFAFDIVWDDLNNGRTGALLALLDSVDAIDGPSGMSTFLRAQDLRQRQPGHEHAAEVIAAYETCITYPDVPFIAFRELGFLYRREGDAARARSSFQRYLTSAPAAVDAPIIRSYLENP
jgi:hypothetical protein